MRLGGGMCPADSAFLLLLCISETTSDFGRTEGRMPRSVNMVLYDGDALFEFPSKIEVPH